MNWKAVLALALVLNVALVFAAWSQRRSRPATPAIEVRDVHIPSGTRWITNVVPETNVVRRTFHWSEIESADYAQYVANLRGIGCPENTIRDILTADLNVIFDARARALAEGPARQFWELMLNSKKFEALVTEKQAELSRLDDERDELLQSLLGTNTPPGTVR